ncbi:hypothetical protein [Roseicella sp. DB1501]|uniref:hypothetical protein n=1 Tax=Roseicella sp. DB1501 TaxID=2730925 RepID=UPI00149279DC|nr:hypothetical protein [Roseicella sp. DB1501]NOG73761.1 hypothetical protein [Roseicella sp. DB1501]
MSDSTDDAPRPEGRPTKYRDEYTEQAYKICLLGATDKTLGEIFGVCEATINNWKLEHPEFADALRRGKKVADMHIASKLFNRAEGAEWTEEAAFKVKEEFFDDTGKKIKTEEKIVTVPVKKAAPPDTTAAMFWLKNRHPEAWRDKQDIELAGPNGGAITTASATLSREELKTMIEQAEQDV